VDIVVGVHNLQHPGQELIECCVSESFADQLLAEIVNRSLKNLAGRLFQLLHAGVGPRLAKELQRTLCGCSEHFCQKLVGRVRQSPQMQLRVQSKVGRKVELRVTALTDYIANKVRSASCARLQFEFTCQ